MSVSLNIFIQVQHNAIDARDELPDDYKFASELIVANTADPRPNPEEQLLMDEEEALNNFFTDVSIRVELRDYLRNARR